jgi:poly(3-hydroxybutyrate) depolymerase
VGVVLRERTSALAAFLAVGALFGCTSTGGHPSPGNQDAASVSDAARADSEGGEDAIGSSDGGAPAPDGGSPGCGTAQTPGQSEKVMRLGGQVRSYYLSIPAGYDPNAAHPLVFGFHGLGGTGEAFRAAGLEMEQAMNTAVFVYPDGQPQPSFQDQTGWVLDPAGSDFAFFDTLIQTMNAEFCLDEHRLFVYGFSFGAMFSDSLGCYRANALRAIGAAAGSLADTYGPCVGTTAAVLVHADDDQTVPIDQGRIARDHYLMANGCQASSPMPIAPSPCVAYQHCHPDQPVVWCEMTTGGHAWINPPTNEAIWGLFRSLD